MEKILQEQNQLQKCERKLETLTLNEIGDILISVNISRPNNFLLLSPEEWKWICVEIKKDFPDMKLEQFIRIITAGIKGKFNERQFCVNAFTIFRWLDIAIGRKKISKNGSEVQLASARWKPGVWYHQENPHIFQSDKFYDYEFQIAIKQHGEDSEQVKNIKSQWGFAKSERP